MCRCSNTFPRNLNHKKLWKYQLLQLSLSLTSKSHQVVTGISIIMSESGMTFIFAWHQNKLNWFILTLPISEMRSSILKVRCRFLDSENLWCSSIDSKDNSLRCAEFLWSDLEIFPKVSLGLKKVLRQMHSWPRCSGNKFIPSMTRIGKQESCCRWWNIIFDKVHRAISSHKPEKINS